MRERVERLPATGVMEKRLLDAAEVCYYLSLGRNRGIEFAKGIGAEIKVGRRSLYDRAKIDQYFNELTGVER